MKTLSVSILVPVYKGSSYLKEALESVIHQDFPYLEIIVCDDNKTTDEDEITKTKAIVEQYTNKKITYVKNKTNLGSQGNIKKLASLAKGDILFYLCQDDILLRDALHKTYDAFFINETIGAVTRPYFWFDEKKKPIRAVLPPHPKKNTVLSIFDGEKAVQTIFGSVGQISGLAYRKTFIESPFNTDIFPGHIYPFASILKSHNCVFLKDFTVAVRTESSQSRNISSIYKQSPLKAWVKMLNSVFKEPRYKKVKEYAIKHIATHYEGLVQIKNFAPSGALMREIRMHLRYYPASLFNPKFWLYSGLTLLLPKQIVLPLSDAYKKYILSSRLTFIKASL